MGKSNTKSTLKIIAAVIVLMALMGFTMYLYAETVVELWKLMLYSFAGAFILWMIFKYIWQRLYPNVNVVLRFLVHIIFFTLILSGVLLGFNSLGADESSAETVEAQVVRKYEQTRYHSRRVGRGRYVKGEKYLTYHVELQLPDGRRKTLTVSRERYNRVASNRPYPVMLKTGLFGWPIMTHKTNVTQSDSITHKHTAL